MFQITNKLLRTETGQDAVSRLTTLSWFKKFQKICGKAVIDDPIKFVNPLPIIADLEVELLDDSDVVSPEVEMDEMFAGKKAKAHRGTSKKTGIVFGIVEKSGGNKCVLYIVENRTKATLHPIIEKHIAKTCVIHHDDYATYRNLDRDLQYQHIIVTHCETFVADDGTHTNKIEGLWGLLRQRISSRHGTYQSAFQDLLNEFSFRRNFQDRSGTIWCSFIDQLKVHHRK